MILQVFDQPPRQSSVTMVGAGKSAGHGGNGVGVVAGIDSGVENLLEVLRNLQETPEGARERSQDIRPIVPGGEGGLAGGQ